MLPLMRNLRCHIRRNGAELASPARLRRDPTYAVARSMAAPVLHVRQEAKTGDSGKHAEHASTEDGPEDADTPRSFASESSSGLDTPTRGVLPQTTLHVLELRQYVLICNVNVRSILGNESLI